MNSYNKTDCHMLLYSLRPVNTLCKIGAGTLLASWLDLDCEGKNRLFDWQDQDQDLLIIFIVTSKGGRANL